MDWRGIKAGCRIKGAALQADDGAAAQFDAAPSASGVSMDQRPRPASVWPRLRHGGVNGFLPLPDRQKPRAVKSISGMNRAFVPTLCTARPGARRARHLLSNV